jgi:putative phosphoribosyl transferase
VIFEKRQHAGRLLADRLSSYKGKNPLVLAIPRGAVPMAKIIADALGGELDVVLVRKLGHPLQPELAIGAIDESGQVILLNHALEIEPEYIEAEKKRQLEILHRRRTTYTPSRAPIDCRERIVIVIDDGIATGSTMTAALRVVRAREPARLLAAVAVAAPQAARSIEQEADAVVCLHVPAEFYAVGQFFKDFSQVSDSDVIKILQQRESRAAALR